MDNLIFQSAASLARMIRKKEISSLELLALYRAQIEAKDNEINAVIWRDFDRAEAQAIKADEALARGENWGPLHGLPITVKENNDYIGAPTTRGAEHFRNNYPQENGEALQHLLDAGAIVMGKTNVPRLLADWQSYNEIHGVTRNPYDLTRTPGGSSGGSAASAAAGFCAMEFGSDGGGSIRIPCHFCGVAGHKSSYGVISKIGAGLSSSKVQADTSVLGPISRHAEDLALCMDIVAKPAAIDAGAWSLTLPRSRHNTLSDFRVGVKLDDPLGRLDDGYRTQLEALVDRIGSTGAKVAKAEPDLDFAHNHEVYTRMIRAATSTRYTDQEIAQFEAMLAQMNPDTSIAQSILATLTSHREWLGWDAKRQALRDRWTTFFKDWDVLICPVFPTAAFTIDMETPTLKRTLDLNGNPHPYLDFLFWPGVPNAVYLPATTVPIGEVEGLPVGVQIIGPYLEDHTTIEFARLIELEFGGFKPPT